MSQWTPRSNTYRNLCRQVKREEPICWLCGKMIDPHLKYPHKWSFSNDHIIPASVRPDLAEVRSNCHASHLDCNRRRATGKPKKRSNIVHVEGF